MSTVAQRFSAKSQKIFSKLFGVDPELLGLDDLVPTEGLGGDLGAAIGYQESITFIDEFRRILLPAAFARDGDGFLARQATDMARQLVIMDPIRYRAQAAAFLDQEKIPALQAMVIVEALRRLAEKSDSSVIQSSKARTGYAPKTKTKTEPRTKITRPEVQKAAAVSYGADASAVEERKQINYARMKAALVGQVTFTISFDDPQALDAEFAAPEKAVLALRQLGFEQIAKHTNGDKLTKFKHKKSGLILIMTEDGDSLPTYSLGFGLLEGTFVPGTYEDMRANSSHKVTVDLGDGKKQQRRLTFYTIKNFASDELPERLLQLQALVDSQMFVLTPYVNAATTTKVGTRITIEAKFNHRANVNDSAPTVAKLLSLNNIYLDTRQRRAPPPTAAGKIMFPAGGVGGSPSTGAVVNCIFVGMQGPPLMSILKRLQGDQASSYAASARNAALEVASSLGPLPEIIPQFIRSSDVVNYEAAIDRLQRGRNNLVCIGVTQGTHKDVTGFMQRLRRNGQTCLAIAIFDHGFSSTDIAALSSAGFDRVIANNEDPAVIEAMMQSLVRNDIVRVMGEAGSESYGPIHINWDTLGSRSTRRIDTVSVEDKKGRKKNIHLTGKEVTVLERMAQTPGTVISKEQFLNYLYGGMDEPEIKIVDVFICKLRHKLEAAMREVEYENPNGLIATVWGKGYLLNPNFGSNTPEVASRPTTNTALFESNGDFPAQVFG